VALGLLALLTLLYTGVNLYRLDHYYPLDYDLSIFGQGLWRLGRGETPFVTVRGMNLFGEHATYVHLFLAPLYRGPLADVRSLVLLQSLALALGSLLLHGIARRELGGPAARLVLAVWLLYPPLQHTWLEYYEPLALAVPLLVAAFDAVRSGRDRWALASSAAALLCMENLTVTVGALGLYALARGRRRLGAALVAGSALWGTLLMTIVFPALHAGGYVYGDRLYGDFARNLSGALLHLMRPDHLAARLFTPVNGTYLLGLLAPVGFLPLAAPVPLLVAAQLPLNLVSSWPYAHEIRYHYVAPIMPFVGLALVDALARTPVGSRARRRLGAVLVVGLAAGQAFFGSLWLRPRGAGGAWRPAGADQALRRETRALLAHVPGDAALSVHYPFLPHLAERHRLYMFPELGPEWPDALIVDLDLVAESPHEAAVLARCREEGGFREAARTSTGTALFVRPGFRLLPSPGEVPISPPVGLLPAPPAPSP
jgi:hypothetical protein